VSLRVACLAWVSLLATSAHASALASDAADDAAYAAGWTQGSNGGSGWSGGWSFATSNAQPGDTDHFIGSSTLNGNGDGDGDGDIDTAGKAFGLSARSSASVNAYRTLTGTVAVGDAVTFDLDAEQQGGNAFATVNLLGGGSIRLDFRMSGGFANYVVFDASGFSDTGVPVSDEGVHVVLVVTGANAYELRITPRGGSTTTSTGTLLAGAAIDVFRFTAQGDGTGTLRQSYVNSLRVPEPGCFAAAAAAIAGLGALQRGRRRSDQPTH
jgi:hypothetical protein